MNINPILIPPKRGANTGLFSYIEIKEIEVETVYGERPGKGVSSSVTVDRTSRGWVPRSQVGE
jgi:hypothetical protein